MRRVAFTAHTTSVQLRPPAPYDVLASSTKSEHDSTRLGPTSCAIGSSGLAGGIATIVEAFDVGQHEQSWCSQWGRISPPNTVMLSPGMRVACASSVAAITSSAVHAHIATLAAANSISASQ